MNNKIHISDTQRDPSRRIHVVKNYLMSIDSVVYDVDVMFPQGEVHNVYDYSSGDEIKNSTSITTKANKYLKTLPEVQSLIKSTKELINKLK